MRYYAQQAPRGFANEVVVHSFCSRADRNAWVERHKDDGDCNSATRGARACTAAEARHILARKSDDATRQYNSLLVHEPLAEEDAAAADYAAKAAEWREQAK